MTMADEKTARYVAYIDSLITVSPKSQSAISREMGYKNPNNLSLIKSGKIPLPVDKVRPLAEALNADPVRLMMMVLEARQPELAEFLRDEGISPLTPEERQVLEAFRNRFPSQTDGVEQVVEAIKKL
ncbi:TPA: XRE family transcriptional regulator [Klebsiella oxytoca]|nr:XRE family transcriptional regulator [Klebsiella aerogenes]HCQ8366916.1 XRE family transcriptional regulator [Klebsiella oxytoca]